MTNKNTNATTSKNQNDNKNCESCGKKPILECFKDYTGSQSDCDRLKQYIAEEICKTKPPKKSSTNNQSVSTNNSIQPYFIDIKICPKNGLNSSTIGCCNNKQFVCVKSVGEPIKGLPCQRNGIGPPCCMKISQSNERSSNQTAKPPAPSPTRRTPVKISQTRNAVPKQCTRIGCIHKTPENVCLYDEPCIAHCFNTPPGAKPFKYPNGYSSSVK